jgi:hypothetical protein
MATNYTTNTAALKATRADVQKLDAKSIDAKTIKLNGINIENLLSSGGGSNIIIEDGREVKTKYDIWEHAAVENEDGSITVKNLYVPDASGWTDEFGVDFNIGTGSSWFISTNSSVISCVDGKMYAKEDGDVSLSNLGTFVANIDTSKIVNGSNLFMQQVEGSMIGGGGDEYE